MCQSIFKTDVTVVFIAANHLIGRYACLDVIPYRYCLYKLVNGSLKGCVKDVARVCLYKTLLEKNSESI